MAHKGPMSEAAHMSSLNNRHPATCMHQAAFSSKRKKICVCETAQYNGNSLTPIETINRRAKRQVQIEVIRTCTYY